MNPSDRHRIRRTGREPIRAGVPQALLRLVGITALASMGFLLVSCDDHEVVINSPLTCDAAPEFTEGPLPLEVCFVEVATGGLSPYSYNWDFGDGGSTTEQDPCHTYQERGTYTATLSVSDSDENDCQVIDLTVEAGLVLPVVYDEPGQYGKTFTVEDADGTICEESVTVSVQ